MSPTGETMRLVYPLDLTLVLPMRLQEVTSKRSPMAPPGDPLGDPLRLPDWFPVNDPIRRDCAGHEDGFAYAEMVYFHPQVRAFLYDSAGGPGGGTETGVRIYRHRGFPRPLLRVDETETVFEASDVLLHHFRPEIAMLTIRLTAREPVPWPEARDAISYLRTLYFQHYEWNDDLKTWKGGGAGMADGLAFGLTGKTPPPAGERKGREDRREELQAALEPEGGPTPLGHWEELLKPLREAGMRVRELNDHRIPMMVFAGLEDPLQLTNDEWFALAQADGDGFPVYSREFCDAELKKAVYDRWWQADAGSTALTQRLLAGPMTFLSVMRWPKERTPGYMHRMRATWKRQQFQIFMLAHYQRAALLVLEERISKCARQKEAPRDEIDKLKADIARFSSGHWFTEVSPQVQGQELYGLLRRHLNLQELYECVVEDKGLLGSWLDARDAKENEATWNRINKWYLPAVLAVTSLGAAVVIEPLGKVLVAAMGFGVEKQTDLEKVWSGLLGSVIFMLLVLVLVWLPIWLGRLKKGKR